MNTFRYTLNAIGRIIACGYGNFDNSIGNIDSMYYPEPFTLFDCQNYRFNFDTNEWVYSPFTGGIREQYQSDLLVELNRKLENDFAWGGHIVKLSESNQKDYLSAYVLLRDIPQLIPVTPYTFKPHSIQYIMSDFAEVQQFTASAFGFVSQAMSDYRNELIRIEFLTDEELYNEINL